MFENLSIRCVPSEKWKKVIITVILHLKYLPLITSDRNNTKNKRGEKRQKRIMHQAQQTESLVHLGQTLTTQNLQGFQCEAL
jgi:hypothetical protein